MTYRLKLGETIQDGFHRIGAEQIQRAIEELRGQRDAARAVHESRKALKRIRALLRLFRPALGKATFTRENAFFRDTGALLSSARDAEVMLETAIKLEASDPRGAKGATAKLRAILGAAASRAENGKTRPAAATEAVARLESHAPAFARLTLKSTSFDTVALGLERSVRRAQRCLIAAYDEGTDEAFHDWRKTVQQHWRHMALLSRAWPELTEARLKAARRLSQCLGDDHDLAILRGQIEVQPPSGLTLRDRRDIGRAIARRQTEIRALAKPAGQQLFADDPRTLARLFETYWDTSATLRAMDAQPAGADDE